MSPNLLDQQYRADWLALERLRRTDPQPWQQCATTCKDCP